MELDGIGGMLEDMGGYKTQIHNGREGKGREGKGKDRDKVLIMPPKL